MHNDPRRAVILVSLNVQSSCQAIPLGAASVASALKADSQIASQASVRLCDFSLEDDDLSGLPVEEAASRIADHILEKAKDHGSIMAGFSVYVWNRAYLEAVSRRLKKIEPSTLTFAGGPEITACAGVSVTAFDFLLTGEGETAARTLVSDWLSGKMEGLPAGSRGDSREGSHAPVVIHGVAENLETLSSPWLDGTLDECPSVKTYRGALWELSRGCPFSCTYCYESKGEKKIRAYPLMRLEKELRHFVKTGIERVFVLDPTYNASRERALSILALIEKIAGGIQYNFEVRAELLDGAFVSAFSKIPCSLQIGLQSSNPEVLKKVGRPGDMKLFSRKIALLNEAGIVFGLDLMYGLPGDTFSSFRSSIDFAIGLYPNNLEIFPLAVLPGTMLADQAQGFHLNYRGEPPYTILATPTFSAQEIERAATLARACDIFYTQGRAVTWFLAALAPLKIKTSQFFEDFAAFLKESGSRYFAASELDHKEAERLQLAFLDKKYRQKNKAWLIAAVRDIVMINGAWTRALAEGEETNLSLSWTPEDLLGPETMDIEYFAENACMEGCTARVYPGPDGPEIDID